MKIYILIPLLTLFLTACASLDRAQLNVVCKDSYTYNLGIAAAALQENQSYIKFANCPAEQQEALKQSYNKGYDHYIQQESNTVGQFGGPGGVGAEIRFACVGSLFGKTYVGKGQVERIARTHLRYVCNASDNSVHCNNMFVRCRRVNFNKRPL